MKILPIVIFLVLFGCGKKDYQPQPASFEACLEQGRMFVEGVCVDGSSRDADQTRYLLLEDREFTKIFGQSQVSICLDAEEQSLPRALVLEDMIHKAITQWLIPLQDLGLSLPSILVTRSPSDGCDPDADAVVHLQSELKRPDQFNRRAYTAPWSREMWLGFADIDAGFGTILHEFGHLFGLADTYVEGQWDCRPEFPNSLMCDPQWATLLPVDREQIRRIFCLETKGQHPGCFNHVPRELLALPDNEILRCSDATDSLVIHSSSALRQGPNVTPRQRSRAAHESFYSTDSHSVLESSDGSAALIDFRVVDIDHKALVPGINRFRLRLEGRTALLQFQDEGISREKFFNSCTLTSSFRDYLNRSQP